MLEPLCSWWRLFQACFQNGKISSAWGVLWITEVFTRVFFLGSKVLCSSRTIWNWNYLFSTTVPNILLQPTESQSTRLLYRWTADSKWRCKNKQTDKKKDFCLLIQFQFNFYHRQMKPAIFCNNLNVVSVRSKLRGKLGITKISEKKKTNGRVTKASTNLIIKKQRWIDMHILHRSIMPFKLCHTLYNK